MERELKEKTRSLGFDLVGIAEATAADGFDRLEEWLDQGYAGEMSYLERRRKAYRHPDAVLPGVRSVVMVAMNYNATDRRSVESGVETTRRDSHPAIQGRVASYALARDYHDVVRERLERLLAWIAGRVPNVRGRCVVDTAPLLERGLARKAGLGWFGKNTMLLNKHLGSYFFLGALLLDIKLKPDLPHESAHCGTCTACLDACPTSAFVGPGMLDSRRCISYLTIELRGSIPVPLRTQMDNWVFGCDVCQDVCPWNRKAPLTTVEDFTPRPELQAPDLIGMVALTPETFKAHFGDTALTRARRSGLVRNAAIALGNRGDQSALPALELVARDQDEAVREAAQWAIAEIQSRSGAEVTTAAGDRVDSSDPGPAGIMAAGRQSGEADPASR